MRLNGRTTLSALMAATLGLGTAAQAQDKPHDGVTVNVMTFTGPQIAEPLQRRGKEFSEDTGATINVITVPFSDLYQKVLTDWLTGTDSLDAAVFAPQWSVDYVVPGLLEDLSERVAADEALQADDIAEFFRLDVPTDPEPDDPISVDRATFEALRERLVAEGIDTPIDADTAWKRWRGWRVNYDRSVEVLATLTNATTTHQR